MVMWWYLPDRRLTAAEAKSQPKDKTCLACGGRLLRLAERESRFPYHWFPCGYVCSSCNNMFVEIGR